MFSVEEKLSQQGRGTEAAVQVVTAPTTEAEEDFPDGGLRAWLVVIGCFVVNTVTVSFWYIISPHSSNSPLTYIVVSFVSVIPA